MLLNLNKVQINTTLIISILIVVFNFNMAAQQTKDTIFVKKSFWGNSYIINDTKYTKSEIEQKINDNQAIASLINKSNTQKVIGTIALPIGVLLTIASINEIVTADFNYGTAPKSDLFPLMVGGAVILDIVGILLLSSSKRNFNSAINLYNGNQLKTTGANNYHLDLHLGINQIGLSLRF